MATENGLQKAAADYGALLKARNSLIIMQTYEELRIERAIVEASMKAGYPKVNIWDCSSGVVDFAGKVVPPGREARDCGVVLQAIADSKERAVWILRDLPAWFGDPAIVRSLRNLSRALPATPRDEARAIVILTTPDTKIPPELSDHAIMLKWSLPDRAELADVVDNVVKGVPGRGDTDAAKAKDRATVWDDFTSVREAAIEAAIGLSKEAATRSFTHSIVTQDRKIVPSVIAEEKRRIISGKGLEWFPVDMRGLAAVGGNEYLKEYLSESKLGFSQKARDFGLPRPNGIVIAGVSGTGKSLTAKVTGAVLGLPLLRLDPGAMQSKWVGESQANIRATLSVVDAIGNCILWIDEGEKVFGGASQGAADGGVSSDQLGTFLTWMQEHKGNVFVIMTCNDVRALPPELLRKGRFDEVFWLDLPTQTEREDILRVTLKQFRREAHPVDVKAVAVACDKFVGAEIAALMRPVLSRAFVDGEREVTTADFLKAVGEVVPLAKTSSSKIDELREWAKTRARPASKPEVIAATGEGRDLDL